MPAIALVVIGVIMLSGDGGGAAVGGGLIAVGAVLFLIGLLIGNTLQAIFSVALYRFATGSTEIAPFTATELQGVLRVKS